VDHDQLYAAEILVGATVSGVTFGHSDLTLMLAREDFSLFGELCKAPIFVHLTNRWRLVQGDGRNSEIEELPIDEQLSLLYELRNLSIIKAEILRPVPHLKIYFENGIRLLINGHDDRYETWQFGIEGVQVTGLAGGKVGILHPSRSDLLKREN
jgi:hypothetical protein